MLLTAFAFEHLYMLKVIFFPQVTFSFLLLLCMVMSVKQRKTPITTKESQKLPEKKITYNIFMNMYVVQVQFNTGFNFYYPSNDFVMIPSIASTHVKFPQQSFAVITVKMCAKFAKIPSLTY